MKYGFFSAGEKLVFSWRFYCVSRKKAPSWPTSRFSSRWRRSGILMIRLPLLIGHFFCCIDRNTHPAGIARRCRYGCIQLLSVRLARETRVDGWLVPKPDPGRSTTLDLFASSKRNSLGWSFLELFDKVGAIELLTLDFEIQQVSSRRLCSRRAPAGFSGHGIVHPGDGGSGVSWLSFSYIREKGKKKGKPG